ncbi:hypothetical protein BH09CHL1_BH09CHL1_29690 [soil metagenome]
MERNILSKLIDEEEYLKYATIALHEVENNRNPMPTKRTHAYTTTANCWPVDIDPKVI